MTLFHTNIIVPNSGLNIKRNPKLPNTIGGPGVFVIDENANESLIFLRNRSSNHAVNIFASGSFETPATGTYSAINIDLFSPYGEGVYIERLLGSDDSSTTSTRASLIKLVSRAFDGDNTNESPAMEIDTNGRGIAIGAGGYGLNINAGGSNGEAAIQVLNQTGASGIAVIAGGINSIGGYFYSSSSAGTPLIVANDSNSNALVVQNNGSAAGISVNNILGSNGIAVASQTGTSIQVNHTGDSAAVSIGHTGSNGNSLSISHGVAGVANTVISTTAGTFGVFLSHGASATNTALNISNAASTTSLGIGHTGSTGQSISVLHSPNSNNAILVSTNGSLTAQIMTLRATRAATSSYRFLNCQSSNGADNEMILRGDGVILSDGGTTTPADYAEMMETLDPSGLPFGILVQLTRENGQRDKIEPATNAARIIGVTSASPAIIADGQWGRWKDKYLKDDWGRYRINTSGERILNPNYDPANQYIPRSERPEWIAVGMLGKIWTRCATQNIDVGDYVTLATSGITRKASLAEVTDYQVPTWPVLETKSYRPGKRLRPVRILFR